MRQPANTWTNVGFLVIGIVILRMTSRGRSPHLRGLGTVCIVTAFGSAFYHASETFIGRVADYVGMYLGASYMLSVNVSRWRRRSGTAIRSLFWATTVVPLGVMLVEPRLATPIYEAVTVLCCLGLEVALFFRDGKVTRYRSLSVYWGLFLIGYAFWQLDLHHVLCDPRNHVLSGHGMWHLLNAAALLYLFFYYEQFEALRDLRVP